jgi:predicted nuclease of predicted toxin-antitoxin system
LKVLLDACLSPKAKAELESAGHDTIWTGDWPEDPGDEELLSHAHQEGRVLITLDKDFGELAVLRGYSHSGIIRLVNFRAAAQGRVSLQILAKHGGELANGAIITAEPGRIRVRQP